MTEAEALRTRGFCRFAGAVAEELDGLAALLSAHDAAGAGQRLAEEPALAEWLAASLQFVLTTLSIPASRPVRAILFDKSPEANWSLGWHQDRTICVRERHETPGFGPWTVKQGLIHVEPPFSYIEKMVTLRIHLDAVDSLNAPLLVAEGSHDRGRVAAERIDTIARACPQTACLANPGDVWAYCTPILHASRRSAKPARRRVLQVDYSADDLPGGLEWLGVG